MYSNGIIDQKRLGECRIKEENGEFVTDKITKLAELKNSGGEEKVLSEITDRAETWMVIDDNGKSRKD